MATATYRAVMMTKKGGPEVLETVELPVREPGPGEARIRVTACGVGATDIIMRRGYYPFAPKIPFVQGYDPVGVVDAVGDGVTTVKPGDKVCALTVHGGQAELLYRNADELVHVPAGLDDTAVVALVLNYATAYQMIHRVAHQTAGQTALVTGANGGVGQALLELLRVAGVTAYGAASARSHELVRNLGGIPIEGREAPVDASLRAVLPDGVDVAYDALGGRFIAQCARATKKKGLVISYGFSAATKADSVQPSNLAVVRGYFDLFVRTRIAGRRSKFYGITALYRKDKQPFLEDMPKLLDLLARNQVHPRIAARFGLLDARAANEMQEKGSVDGKIVLVRADPA
jgi:NADPH:quinone reductase